MTHVVALRPLSVQDAAAMAEVLSSPELYKFTGGEPPSVEELERRYEVQTRGTSPDGTEEWVNLVVVLEPGGQPIGYVQATIPQDGDSAEIAWVIGRQRQGKGYATRAAELLVTHLADRQVRGLLAHIHPGHEASKAIARSLRMTPTDKVVDGEVRWEGRTQLASSRVD